MGGSDLLPRVPLTLPMADKVPMPPSPEVLRGFQRTGCPVPVEEDEEKRVDILLRLCAVAGCDPMENPSASGGSAGGSPRGGSGAFTRSSGLPKL